MLIKGIHGLRYFFHLCILRQESDKVHESEEPVSYMKISFVKGDDRDNCLLRIKGVIR